MQKTLILNLTAIFLLIAAFMFTVGPARAANRDDMQQKIQAYHYQVSPQPASNNFQSWQLASVLVVVSFLGIQYYYQKGRRFDSV